MLKGCYFKRWRSSLDLGWSRARGLLTIKCLLVTIAVENSSVSIKLVIIQKDILSIHQKERLLQRAHEQDESAFFNSLPPGQRLWFLPATKQFVRYLPFCRVAIWWNSQVIYQYYCYSTHRNTHAHTHKHKLWTTPTTLNHLKNPHSVVDYKYIHKDNMVTRLIFFPVICELQGQSNQLRVPLGVLNKIKWVGSHFKKNFARARGVKHKNWKNHEIMKIWRVFFSRFL